jgi:hypothetical protein
MLRRKYARRWRILVTLHDERMHALTACVALAATVTNRLQRRNSRSCWVGGCMRFSVSFSVVGLALLLPSAASAQPWVTACYETICNPAVMRQLTDPRLAARAASGLNGAYNQYRRLDRYIARQPLPNGTLGRQTTPAYVPMPRPTFNSRAFQGGMLGRQTTPAYVPMPRPTFNTRMFQGGSLGRQTTPAYVRRPWQR